MSAKIELGQLITTSQAKRDAVHVAIAPAATREPVKPGTRVRIVAGYAEEVAANEKCDGIVDPFLTEPVPAYHTFWLFLLPGTVTNLRHEWDHPSFPDDTEEDSFEDDGCRGC